MPENPRKDKASSKGNTVSICEWTAPKSAPNPASHQLGLALCVQDTADNEVPQLLGAYSMRSAVLSTLYDLFHSSAHSPMGFSYAIPTL